MRVILSATDNVALFILYVKNLFTKKYLTIGYTLYIFSIYKQERYKMNTYIAKIKNHQSIIYLATDSKDAVEWAIALKRGMYGEDSELVSIWNHDENKYIEV